MCSAVPHLPAGAILGGGKYRITRFIGAGGFGCTYQAEDTTLGVSVAIKEFYINDFCDRDATGGVSVVSKGKVGLIDKLKGKFLDEARNIARMRHNNIVRVSGLFDENGTSYYVMDFISGCSLQDMIETQGPLPEARALRYIGHVMDALEYVHAKNMLHLDVKPDNIMIDAETDRAILIDFGVSKQYDEADGHNTSTIMGQTPGYAPPEQGGNNIRQFTPAADIYALGATLYAILTGIVPPSSNDMISGFARLAPLPAGTSPAIKNAIGRMMQPNALNRPQSIPAVRALLGILAPVVPPEPPVPPVTPPAPPVTPPAPVVPPVKNGSNATVEMRSGASPGNHTEHFNSGAVSKGKSKSLKWLWASLIVVLAVGIVVSFLLTFPLNAPATEDAVEPWYVEEAVEPAPVEGVEAPDCEVVAEEPECAEVVEESWDWKEAPSEPEKNPRATAASGTLNGYEYVDMGTSAMWATCNVGASSPYGIGNYYSLQGAKSASGRWGSYWRLPTKNDFQELMDRCEWTWTGDGYRVKSKVNDNELFFPAAGWDANSGIEYRNEYGNYLSSTPSGEADAVWYLAFDLSEWHLADNYRSDGRSLRLVWDARE